MHPSLMEHIAQAHQPELRSHAVRAGKVRRPFDFNGRFGWLMVMVGLRLALRSARRRRAIAS